MTANRQPLSAPPNRLAGESAPNTLGGIGLPRGGSSLRRPRGLTVALTSAVLAVLALGFALLVWRPA